MSLVEKCWMVTSRAYIVTIFIITGVCFSRLVSPYMKKKKGAVTVGIVYILTMLVLYVIPQQIDNFFAYMLGIFAAFIAMYANDRRNLRQKIFLAVTFFSIRWLAFAMASGINDIVMNAAVFQKTMAEKVWLQYVIYIVIRVFDTALCTFFMAGSVWLINKEYVYKNDEMSTKELAMLGTPSLLGVTGYGVLQYGFGGALSFLHCLISITAILVMIVMFQKWKESREEQRGQELVASQINDMKKHIAEVEKLYQDIRCMRHDMGNHIQTLEHLVANNGTDDAVEYLEHLKKEWDNVSPMVRTGSPVIDVILMEKMREAEEKNIRFTADFHYPENTKLNAFDLSVIMNNALRNCMENVSGDNLYISVTSFRKNSIFMITVKNSFEGRFELDEGGLPRTTKSGREHGIGLNNIRRVARMYMGDIAFEQENGEVILSIMLQVE